MKTDHILFIASGAFHLAKPSDLLPELQGRLPIRVELSPLSRDDLRRILTEPEHSLLKQYAALMRTEGVQLGIRRERDRRAGGSGGGHQRPGREHRRAAAATVLERLLEEISFTATDRNGETIMVDAATVRDRVAPLAAEGRSEPIHPVILRPRGVITAVVTEAGMATLKLIAMGNSVGVVLPKEMLGKLNVAKGDTLYAIEMPDGDDNLTRSDHFEAQMEVARRIMKERYATCCANSRSDRGVCRLARPAVSCRQIRCPGRANMAASAGGRDMLG